MHMEPGCASQYTAVLDAMAAAFGGEPLPAECLEQAVVIVQVCRASLALPWPLISACAPDSAGCWPPVGVLTRSQAPKLLHESKQNRPKLPDGSKENRHNRQPFRSAHPPRVEPAVRPHLSSAFISGNQDRAPKRISRHVTPLEDS